MSRYHSQLIIILLATASLYSNAKSMKPKHNIEIVAHRGARAFAPENTIASADSAIAHGAKWIEVDVRPSKDGEMYNLHDESLNRTTTGKGNISDWMSADIEKLDCGSWFSEKYRGTRIPTIETMIDAMDGRANISFDVKPGINIADLINLVRKKKYASHSYFYLPTEDMLREFVKLAPEMRIKVIASDTQQLEYWCTICKPASVEIYVNENTPALLEYCHKNKIKVMVSALGEDKNADDYRTAMETGADMIFLDKPDLFEQVRKGAKIITSNTIK